MIKSMTGYGFSEKSDGKLNVSSEIKSINHRFNDVIIKLPKQYAQLEDKIKKLILKKVSRGKIECIISVDLLEDSFFDIDVDVELAKQFLLKARELSETLGIHNDLKLSDLMDREDIVLLRRRSIDVEEAWPLFEETLSSALGNLIRLRELEGRHIKSDFENRINFIEEAILKIEEFNEYQPQLYLNKLNERISKLFSKGQFDDQRLAQEAAIIADKSDITEELTRLKSHITKFREILEEKEPVGRKLDFLIQEFNREANTICSKSFDERIISVGVELKAEIEKIREQVQNIE